MLVPVRTSGRKSPLFLVHGMHGLMTLNPLVRELGPDQPVYAVHADGIDGQRVPRHSVRDMVLGYTQEIHAARPAGRILVAGECVSCTAAIDIARELQHRGRQVGPVILVDPPPVPGGLKKQNRAIDPSKPEIAQRLYQQSQRFFLRRRESPSLPFDPGDPRQLHLATLTGVASTLAFGRHIPTPFPGPTVVILSAQHAGGFFHPQLPWRRLISMSLMVHVLPYDHLPMFWYAQQHIARALTFMLEEVERLELPLNRQRKAAVA